MDTPTRAKSALPSVSYSFDIQTPGYRNLPIPGLNGDRARVGDCYARVTDLPIRLDEFMGVNPRVPSRTAKGVLRGPVIKGILETLRERPQDMAIMNNGLHLLVADAQFEKQPGGVGILTIRLDDPTLHGIVNGGHTYAAIREAIDSADEHESAALERAFVRLHILQGIDSEMVPQIAEGLNRSKQVDDPSIANLRGWFDGIREVMKGKPGAESIAYSQGEEGEVYIRDVLVYLQLFNCERYSDDKHPHGLYKRPATGLRELQQDLDRRDRGEKNAIDLLIPRLPEILRLADELRYCTPEAAKRVGFEFGRLKVGKKRRAGSKGSATPLPFADKMSNYRVPKGWLFPMLAGFRANVKWDLESETFEWIVPLKQLLPEILDSIVKVCVVEHKDNNLPPQAVGRRESSYRQCYDKVVINLARRGVLSS